MILKFNFGALAVANICILKVGEGIIMLAWRTTARKILIQAEMVGDRGSIFATENITETLKKL